MHTCLTNLVSNIEIPRFLPVYQSFPAVTLHPEAIRGELEWQLAQVADRIRPGMTVCIPCGSRGIANIVLILKTVVDFCLTQGAKPFVIPAMGSHGGATVPGQIEVLESLGVTEQTVGCPIRATMDTVEVGRTDDGRSVYFDAYAAKADAILVINRIKPHTSFRGPYESGLMKMLVIGMGKQRGAAACHDLGYKYMHKSLPDFGSVILKKMPVVFGVAILENAADETAELHVIPVEEIPEREPELLKKAACLMPRLLIDACDILVVEEIGKNISGGGMDPNITGAFATPYASGGIRAQLRCILSLTEQTHGNGYGMGAADVVSERLYRALDPVITYPNAITSTALSFAKLPLVMPNDRDSIRLCIRSATDLGPKGPRIILIRNTLQLDRILVSEAMAEALAEIPGLCPAGEARELPFDAKGSLEGWNIWKEWFQ